MTKLKIHIIPLLRDNYGYLLESAGESALIDPSEALPVLTYLKKKNINLGTILNTHHHHDHVGGNLEIKSQTGCRIMGFEGDAHRIPGIDHTLKDGSTFTLGKHKAQILHIPGHTLGHIAYYFEDPGVVFTGDTLFSLGCGRLFEGTPAQMWVSLKRLRALPEETKVYCGHEYTCDNGRFALTIDSENENLLTYHKSCLQKRALGEPSLPSTIGLEQKVNPFFRADNRAFAKALGLDGKNPEQIFEFIRKEKDTFS